MQYFDGITYYTEEEARAIGSGAVLRAFGIFPVATPISTGDILDIVEYGQLCLCGDKYVFDVVVRQQNAFELKNNLKNLKHKLQGRFVTAFVEIDAKTRPMRGALLSVVDGTFPTQAYNADEPQKDLAPEQQQRIVDVGIMWELEEVAQVNRDMQTELMALEITEDMTLEQAQEITLRIANAQPWLPWRE